MYFDDNLLVSTRKMNHLNNLTKVWWHMEERGIKLKFAKSQFMMDVVEYLGHIIDTEDCTPL